MKREKNDVLCNIAGRMMGLKTLQC